MKKSLFTQIIVFIGFIYIFSISCKDQRLIATVGNFPIYSDDYKASYFTGKSPNQIAQIPFTDKLEHLEEMIETKLMLVDAYQSNVDNDSDLVHRVKLAERQQVYLYVVHHYIIDKQLPEKMLRERYALRGQEVKVRHIYLPGGRNQTGEQRKANRAKLDSLREQITGGASFSELARAFSRDSLSAGKGGELGFISWQTHIFGKDFFEAASALKTGELSQVIETRKGQHIVQVLIKREKPQPAFEYEKEKIKKGLFREKRRELDQAYYQFLDNLKGRYHLRFNQDNIKFSIKMLYPDGDSSNTAKMTIPELTEEDKARELANFGDNYNFEELVRDMQKIPPFRRPQLNTVEKMKTHINRVIASDIITQFGYDKGVHKKAKIKEEVETIKHDLMVKSIEKNKVYEKATPTDEECLAYYNANKNQFIERESARVQEIMVTDAEKAQQIFEKIKRGDHFDKLAAAYNEKSTTKNKKGILGYITPEQYGRIGKRANRMKVGEISDIIKMGPTFSIIKILDKKPQTIKSFEASKGSIKRQLRKENNKSARQAWIGELRESIPVQIYEANFKSIFQESE